MKQTEQMREIQERMRPGVITLGGFLGDDGRNLVDILEEDDALVKRLGLTHESIAGRMRELRDAGAAGLGDPVVVAGRFEVSVDIARGKLPCPFGHRGLIRKTIVRVRNIPIDREIVYTDMGIHLIAEHGFYQGSGAPYRLDPDELAEVLEISPPDA